MVSFDMLWTARKHTKLKSLLDLTTRMEEKSAKLISYIFAPTQCALVTFLLLSYLLTQTVDRDIVALVSVLFGSILPFLFILFLRYSAIITHIHVPNRQQRTIPYLICILIYFIGFLILLFINAPLPVSVLMFCYATNTLVVTAINERWKISAHAMGITGPLTLLFIVFGWKSLFAFPLVIIVPWARVKLKVHTVAQVIAGGLLGVPLTAIQTEFLFKLIGSH